MILDTERQHFAERGWLVVDLPEPATIAAVRDRLCGHLRATALPGLQQLEAYHTRVADETQHVAILHDLCRFYWREALGTALISSHLAFFQQFVGLDLHVQKYPYLRAVRPGCSGDAAVLHRDTYYGSSWGHGRRRVGRGSDTGLLLTLAGAEGLNGSYRPPPVSRPDD